jgi:hypothetical protein
MSQLKVNAISDAAGANGNAITLATNGTCTASITNSLSNRNKVINGDMRISQRHGTTAIQLEAVEHYIVDRFKSDTGSSYNLTADGSQSTDVPAGKGFSKSLKIAGDNTNAPTAGQNGGISTFLEGQDVQDFCFGSSDAKPLTLSFWAKSGSQNNGHVYGLMLGAWLGGTRNCQTKSFTVTSSWQKFTMSFAATGTAVSGSAINSDNASGCQIYWSLVCHSDDQKNYSTWTADSGLRGFSSQSNFNDHASNEFYLTGVQLEVDSTGSGVATDFEHRSYGDELLRCQRYYQKLTGGIGGGTSDADKIAYSTVFPVPMRATPSCGATGALTFEEMSDADRTQSSGHAAFRSSRSTEAGATFVLNNFSSIVKDQIYMMNPNHNGTDNRITLSAEL